MGLNIDTGKKERQAEGITPSRLKQYIQLAGRNIFRLGNNGPGAAEKEWKGKDFEKANPNLYGQGGFVVLSVANNGQDFDVVGVSVVQRASQSELDKKVVQFLDTAQQKYAELGDDAASEDEVSEEEE